MMSVRFTRQRRFHVTKLLLSAIFIVQLAACGGGGGSSKTSSERIPDAYRSSSAPEYTTAAEGSSNPNARKTGVLTLSWSAPSARTDGEPLSLSEIDGYRVYYGKHKGEYLKGADIKDGTAESATVTGVPFGAYYVVMTTYDANGIESGYSAAVKKTVSAAMKKTVS
jgi:hypothetical protein